VAEVVGVHHTSKHSCGAAASYLQSASSRGRCHNATVGRSLVLREVAVMFSSEHSRSGAGVKNSMTPCSINHMLLGYAIWGGWSDRFLLNIGFITSVGVQVCDRRPSVRRVLWLTMDNKLSQD
jgi:hypothetical protein